MNIKDLLRQCLKEDNVRSLPVLFTQSSLSKAECFKMCLKYDAVKCVAYFVTKKNFFVDNSVLGQTIKYRKIKCAKFLFLLGIASDLALYYSVKYRCLELFEWFHQQKQLNGIEILIDDCNFFSTLYKYGFIKGNNFKSFLESEYFSPSNRLDLFYIERFKTCLQ